MRGRLTCGAIVGAGCEGELGSASMRHCFWPTLFGLGYLEPKPSLGFELGTSQWVESGLRQSRAVDGHKGIPTRRPPAVSGT
jgi:hypothetical protein